MSVMLNGYGPSRQSKRSRQRVLKSSLSALGFLKNRDPHLCKYLPEWVRRMYWAIVHFVRPVTALRDREVVQAIEQRVEAERVAVESAAERERAAMQRRRDEERIRQSIRAIEAEARSRGAR